MAWFAIAWTPVPVVDDQKLFMPGSQSGSVVIPPVSNCTNCHADFDPVSEPYHNWQGSMMAQATRDPVWLATMTVAIQDSIWALGNPNAADLCIRCHSPTGWLGGRSDPTNATALTTGTGDFEGVSCATCHLAIDPFTANEQQPEVPAETDPALITAAAATRAADATILSALQMFDGSPFYDSGTQLPVNYGDVASPDLLHYIEAASGQFFIETNTKRRRGPRVDVSTKSHDFLYSRFHKSRAICHTCHDVSNPVLANLTYGLGTSENRSAASFFHVERTSSEFELSAYAAPGGAPAAPTFASLGVTQVSNCQDCHMPRVPGKFAKQGSARTDVAQHALTGGNSWISRILASVDSGGSVHDPQNLDLLDGTDYPSATLDVAGLQGISPALLDGEARAIDLLQRAATIDVMEDPPGTAVLHVNNHTGHKLISGFPEGRRMWLNVRFLDAQGQTLSEINPYETLQVSPAGEYLSGGDLTVTNDELVYEAKMSSELTGEDKTFHFVLATDRYKDNRIPPRGFRIAEAASRIAHPRWHGADAPDYFTAEEYAGGYDRVRISKPANAAGWVATLYYQSTSKPYIEFLRNEINGTGTTTLGTPPSGESQSYIVQSDSFFSTLKDWGNAIWDLWVSNGGATPVAMTSAISSPTGLDLTREGPDVTVHFNTILGWEYQVEASDSLRADSWMPVGEEVDGDGLPATVSDSPGLEVERRFYRVRTIETP